MQTLAQPIRRIGGVTLIPAATGGKLSANSLFLPEAGLLIDTGADENALRALAGEVRRVLYTHYHGDHRWHGGLFRDAETWTHELDSAPLESMDGMVAAVATDEASRQAFRAWFQDHVTLLRVDRRISTEDALDFGGAKLVPIHMPGHTPGMLCPYFPEEKLLFLTDYDLTKFGPWYGNTGSDLDAFENSLRRIAAFDAEWFMTSHLPGALRREEMLALLEPYHEQIRSRDERIVDLLKTPQTVQELATVGICYRPAHLRKDPHLVWFEALQLDHHVRRLAKRGAVVEDGGKWRTI